MFEAGEINIDINELVKKYKNKIKFTQGIKPQITLALDNLSEIKMLQEVQLIFSLKSLS